MRRRTRAEERLSIERDEQFRKSLLAALGRLSPPPKRHWIVGCVNSALFIWLLSAVAISSGGAMIAGHRQCMEDTRAATAQYIELKGALMDRITLTKEAIQSSTGFEDFKFRSAGIQQRTAFPDKSNNVIMAQMSNIAGNFFDPSPLITDIFPEIDHFGFFYDDPFTNPESYNEGRATLAAREISPAGFAQSDFSTHCTLYAILQKYILGNQYQTIRTHLVQQLF